MDNDKNQALIFMGVCFGLGVGMILWRIVVSEVLRDWKVCACAKKARKESKPIDVISKSQENTNTVLTLCIWIFKRMKPIGTFLTAHSQLIKLQSAR